MEMASPDRTQNADVAQETTVGSTSVVVPIDAATVCSVHFAPFHVSMMLSELAWPNADVSPSATPTATQYLVVAQDTLVSADVRRALG